MNKCRRMFTLVAEKLAERGIASILPDLYGTGDSDGEFADADEAAWLGDLASAASWARGNGWQVRRLLCVRLGCLLGARASSRLAWPLERTVFWQAVGDGERFLVQFLRLRIAARLKDAGGETVAQLRERLRKGEVIEVGGYDLSGRLAEDVASLRFAGEVATSLGTLHWMEMTRDAEAPLPAPT